MSEKMVHIVAGLDRQALCGADMNQGRHSWVLPVNVEAFQAGDPIDGVALCAGCLEKHQALKTAVTV